MPPTYGVSRDKVVGVIAGGKDCMFRAAEGEEDNAESGMKDIKNVSVTPLDTVVGISVAGDASYVVGAMEYAKSQGCLTVALTANSDAKIAEAACRSSELHIYQIPQAAYMTDELLEYCDGLFDKAEALAEDNTYLQRIKREHLSIRFVRLARKPLGSAGRDSEVAEFFRDIKDFGITEISERVPLEYSSVA